jgi:hypothetical protein
MGTLTNDIINIVENCRRMNEAKPQDIARLTQLGVPMTEICKSIDVYVLYDIVIDYALRNNL